MPFTSRALFRVLLLAGIVALVSGCVTSKKYKMVKDGTLPEQGMELNHALPEAELKFSTVIIIKGPGSWKREARWDEYVVMLTNHGVEPLRVDHAALTDVLGQSQVPGSDPWKLEKLSHTRVCFQASDPWGAPLMLRLTAAPRHALRLIGSAVGFWGRLIAA